MELPAATQAVQNECASFDWSNAFQKLNLNNNNPGEEDSSQDASSSGLKPESSKASSHSQDLSEEVVLHKLAKINGIINKMTDDQLIKQLESFGLNSCGVKDVLKKRLKNFHRRQRISQSKKLRQKEAKMPFKYLVVIDYEATCAQNNNNFIHEIIEFPAVLIDVNNCEVCSVFQRFCRPKLNPRLTEFCTELTGITQEQVDKASDFKEVYREFLEWMKSQELGRENKFAIVTDGPWDMARFLKTQTDLSGVKFPSWAKQWINLRKSFSNFYNLSRVSLHKMLEELGMVFQGRPHCGLDDARNIAAIAICLLNDGCVLRNNEHLHEEKRHMSLSPPKPSSKPRKKERYPAGEDVAQEGESSEDLLYLARLKKS